MTNVTILCANRTRLLKQTLDSLGDLSNATVTIRDAGFDGDAWGIAYEWAQGVGKIAYSPNNIIGTGASRNDVIIQSERSFERGDYLYLSDDDVCFLRPDWLAVLIDAYEAAWEQGYRVLGAYNHPFHHPVSNDGWAYLGKPVVTHAVFPVYALALQSMLMRWEVFDHFGPFDSTPPGAVCQGEDVSFGNRIREAGFKLGVITPPLLVNCGITNSFGQPIPGADLVRAECPEGVLCE